MVSDIEMDKEFDFSGFEKKWQKKWEDAKIFEVSEKSKKKKYYVLDMFPYPSGEGLHMGHAFVYSLGDIFARFKRLQGFNVLYPIGYDSLGLPAENAAIKAGIHPEEYTTKSISNFMKQQKAMGWSYDWSRMLKSHDPEYYKWDQWIFLKMLEKGIAYRKKAPVNWCNKCQTVLANEQVVKGKCWRHEDNDVEIKHLEQWFFKITDYAEELISGLDKLDWPLRAKTMQKNWIGKSFGTEINFEVELSNGNTEMWPVFTTRADTLYGVTFLVVSAQHPRLMDIVDAQQKKDVEGFLKKITTVSKKSIKDVEELDKEGTFTGSYATNPVTGEKVPIWAGNFVVSDYGSGMVMAVPGHDQRDFEFAKKYKINIKPVIDGLITEKRAYSEYGKLINSGEFNGLQSKEAIEKITEYLEKNKLGKKTFNYRLKDWLVSRQRYWGTPIPIVYCDKCGIVPISEKDLPVKLPKNVTFGKGNPLATNKDFLKVKCPKCSGNARRETDTMDTFVNSSWYYLRYCDPHNDKKIFDKDKVKYWTPIDQYIGGPEHITAHLIYVRFYAKFLRDIGLLNFDEPALRYFTQGIIKGVDGEKMSKSRGNVIEPLETIKKYGADTIRLYLVSNGSPENDFVWDPKGLENTQKFLIKVYKYFSDVEELDRKPRLLSRGRSSSIQNTSVTAHRVFDFKKGKSSDKIGNKINKTIKEVTLHIDKFEHNTAIIKLRALFSAFENEKISKDDAESFLKMMHVYCPFITEELWENIDNKEFISLAEWPIADEKKINEKFDIAEKAIEKTVGDILNVLKIIKEKQSKEGEKVYLYVLPNEVENYNSSQLSKRVGKEVVVFAVNDKKKYDPESKAGKTKPGKPGIYVE